VLYVFFVIHHARRTVLHVRVTEHPTGTWIVQKLREAFPFDSSPRYFMFDNDKEYGTDVLAVIVLDERHLHRLLSEFLAYHHDDRTHLGLGKTTLTMRRAPRSCIATPGAKRPDVPTFGTLLAIAAIALVCRNHRGRDDQEPAAMGLGIDGAIPPRRQAGHGE
jgi:hypothetical protein